MGGTHEATRSLASFVGRILIEMSHTSLIRQIRSLLNEAAEAGKPDEITLRHCLNEGWFPTHSSGCLTHGVITAWECVSFASS